MKIRPYRFNKQTTAVIILCLMILATLGFIWGNSFLSIPESREKSLAAARVIEPFLEIFVGKGRVTNHLIRKLAHFSEFGVLGCELMLLLIIRKRDGLQPVVNLLFAGLVVAVIDETIQLFTARGSQVQDIWLDFAGVCAGIAFVLALNSLAKNIRSKSDASLK